MPIVHVAQLDGDDAPKWLAFAHSKLRDWNWFSEADANRQQTFIVPGGYVRICQTGNFQFIYIAVGPVVRYEWFTSEHVDDSLSSPGHSGYLDGSAMRVAFSQGATVKPLYSTVFDPGADGKWLLRSTEANASKDSGLTTWASWQDQKYMESVWYKTVGMVTSTQAQPSGILNKCNWNSPYLATPFANVDSFDADQGLDLPPALYPGPIIAAPQFDRAWQYWRRAAVQSVNGSQFFICTDNFGRFHVYRALAHADNRATNYRTYLPPYPAWVTVPNWDDPLQTVNDWLWRFNSDATKCVSIPFHAEPNTDFRKYVATASMFATLLHPEETGGLKYPELLTVAHDDTPGLVEFSIQINEVGTGELDFEVTFTLQRSSYFSDDKRFFFDAAYFIADPEKIGIAKDTLLTAEIRCMVPAGYYEATLLVGGSGPVYALDGVQNMQSHWVIQSNDASMVAVELLKVPLWTPLDMKYLNGYGVRTYGRPAYTPFAAPFSTFAMPMADDSTTNYGPVGPMPYVIGDVGRSTPLKESYLFALELSSFSLLYSAFDYPTQTGFLRGVAFGKEFYKHDYADLPLRNVPPLLDPAVVVPSARPYQTALNALLAIEPGQGFAVHPAGHWSCAVVGVLGAGVNTTTGDADVDWISVITGKNPDGTLIRRRYRHRDLFNSAFTQTRDYDFYKASFAGKNLVDHGGFRTAGIWVN